MGRVTLGQRQASGRTDGLPPGLAPCLAISTLLQMVCNKVGFSFVCLFVCWYLKVFQENIIHAVIDRQSNYSSSDRWTAQAFWLTSPLSNAHRLHWIGHWELGMIDGALEDKGTPFFVHFHNFERRLLFYQTKLFLVFFLLFVFRLKWGCEMSEATVTRANAYYGGFSEHLCQFMCANDSPFFVLFKL